MIKDTLSSQISEALRKADATRVSTLRMLSSSLHNEEIAKQRSLTEEEEGQIVKREIKRREEAAEAYRKGSRAELAEKEEQEAKILREFLPEQLSEEELEKIVEEAVQETGASSPSDFGKVMGAVMGEVKGAADGKTVSAIVNQKLKPS